MMIARWLKLGASAALVTGALLTARSMGMSESPLEASSPARRLVFTPAPGSTVAADEVPVFEVDPTWPRQLPQGWNWWRTEGDTTAAGRGSDVLGIRADRNDHVWVTNRGSVAEFDPDGNLVQSWNASRPDNTGRQYGAIHGLFVDNDGFVWTTGRENHVVLKFTPQGKLAQVIGTYDETGGSDDPLKLGRPAEIWLDTISKELFVADGYTNRRLVVFDGLTGRYLRHWGADGRPPCDGPRDECPNLQYSTPHGMVGSKDGLVYIADRQNSRVQVFDHMGDFKGEGRTRDGNGGAFSVALSSDPEQQWVYVTDGTGHRIWILQRSDMQVVGSFSEGGPGRGQVGRPHNITTDSQGNIYVAEGDPGDIPVNHAGQRAQKFRMVRPE